MVVLKKAVQDRVTHLQCSSIDFLLLAKDFIPEFFDGQLFALHVLSLQMRLLQEALQGAAHVLGIMTARGGEQEYRC